MRSQEALTANGMCLSVLSDVFAPLNVMPSGLCTPISCINFTGLQTVKQVEALP